MSCSLKFSLLHLSAVQYQIQFRWVPGALFLSTFAKLALLCSQGESYQGKSKVFPNQYFRAHPQGYTNHDEVLASHPQSGAPEHPHVPNLTFFSIAVVVFPIWQFFQNPSVNSQERGKRQTELGFLGENGKCKLHLRVVLTWVYRARFSCSIICQMLAKELLHQT